MENSSSLLAIISFFVCSLMLSSCEGATMVVDGVSQWSNPTANIGDSIIFKHKGGEEEKYRLYIFRSELAFKSCNFTQATLLSDSNNSTSYTWRPSRPGLFYFSFYNGTSMPCQQGQKLAIKITPTSSSSSPSPSPYSPLPSLLSPTPAILPSPTPPTVAPPPTSGGSVGGGTSGGGVVSSSPAYPWPFQPHEKSAGGPTTASIGSGSPIGLDDKGGEGSTPFINSNPAVPLPTGEIDSATYRPLPTSTTTAITNSAGEMVRFMSGALIIISCCSVFFFLWL